MKTEIWCGCQTNISTLCWLSSMWLSVSSAVRIWRNYLIYPHTKTKHQLTQINWAIIMKKGEEKSLFCILCAGDTWFVVFLTIQILSRVAVLTNLTHFTFSLFFSALSCQSSPSTLRQSMKTTKASVTMYVYWRRCKYAWFHLAWSFLNWLSSQSFSVKWKLLNMWNERNDGQN